jgi:hypothetical protein
MTTSQQLQRLQAVLDACGADRSRWPEGERAALEAFVAQNAEAQALVNREAAFDRLLAHAPGQVSVASSQRARASLFAELEAEDRPTTESNVVAMGKPRTDQRPRASFGLWRDLAVMAAALLIGFFSVSGGVLDGSVFDPTQLAATAAGDAEDVSAIALGATEDEFVQEEML